jgi:hypothetical protein
MIVALEEGATSNNLTKVIMKAVIDLTGMSREDTARQMLSFGAGRFHLPCCMSLLENACTYNFHISCIIVHVSLCCVSCCLLNFPCSPDGVNVFQGTTNGVVRQL